MRVGISRKNFHLWNRLLKRKLLQPMVCYRSTEKEKHAYLCRMFNQDRTSGVKPALHKVCCVYASLFPNVPEWEIPRKVFSVLNSSSSTAHWCPVLFFQPFNAFWSTHPCWIGENKIIFCRFIQTGQWQAPHLQLGDNYNFDIPTVVSDPNDRSTPYSVNSKYIKQKLYSSGVRPDAYSSITFGFLMLASANSKRILSG